MTQSSETHLPSSKSQLAVLALSAQGEYGAVTDLGRQHGIRRQEVYALRERAWATLEGELTPPEPEQRGTTSNEERTGPSRRWMS